MPIDETYIRQWADRHDCRRSLPVLVRRLIRETAPSLTSLRFPGNEAVDLAGLDGQAENESKTVWVPAGRSVWEMGCNLDPRAKAQTDFSKRTAGTPQTERQTSSFVFVTPRRWTTKQEWLEERRLEGSWATVHAYDAIDLETWLEAAPVTCRWLGELLGVVSPGLLTPHEWWQRWATASVPPIPLKLVSTRRYNETNTLLTKLRDGEPVVPVQADDRKEAIAFVIASMIESDALDLLDKTLVATTGGVIIPAHTARMIVIADVKEGEEPDFGDRRNMTIVRPYPKGRLDVREALQLSHVPSEVFRSELEGMGLDRDEVAALALQTGHSVPVLRRKLSKDPEIKRPTWARDRTSAKLLLPFAFAGSWVERANVDDEAVLQLLGELADGDVERIRNELLALDDAPIARYGNVNVIVSQLDALFAVGPFIERIDLDRFFQLLPELLCDRDPALDLPQDQWWMANVLGKTRSNSAALLSGLGDALCILSVYGAEICGKRLGLDIANRVAQLVRAMLLNADEERWLTIRGHLRRLAEASPTAFLDCLEAELQKADPAVRSIMGSVDGGTSGECLRTDLLWALELLAWDPANFRRVAEIIFSLRRFEVKDNWSNSPKSTAKSLFLAWLPATSLGMADRMAVLRDLSQLWRRPAMDVCISLLPGGGPGFASRTSRPQWRAIVAEVPVPTNADVREAAVDSSRLLLDMAPFDKAELEKLLEVATRLQPADLNRLVSEVGRWATATDDDEKAELRDELRQRDTMRAYQQNDVDEGLIAAFRQMEAALDPANPAARHRWLFQSSHVTWRALEAGETTGDLSWQDRDAFVARRRSEAISEICEVLGEAAIFRFAMSVKQPALVAQVLVPPDSTVETAAFWAGTALQEKESDASNAFLQRVLWMAGVSDLIGVCSALTSKGLLDDAESRRRIAKQLPGRPVGWAAAEMLGVDVASAFWRTAAIDIWDETSPEKLVYAINKLLEFQRPRSAFSAIILKPERLAPDLCVRILQAITWGEEPDAAPPSAYHLDEVLKYLDTIDEITDNQIANLELPFAALLCSYGHRQHERTLAVHRELARDPAFFVQLLCWHYGRRNGGENPDLAGISVDRRKLLANLAYHTLEGWQKIPGSDDEGAVDQEAFVQWVEDALRLATEVDRREMAEIHIGALLGNFVWHRSWDDWLPDYILAFLDKPENSGLRERFDLGVRNARGVTVRGPYDGGNQERDLAGKYRKLALRYGNSYPRVSALITSIAEEYDWDASRADERAAVGERWHV
jgi:hypothetical protein